MGLDITSISRIEKVKEEEGFYINEGSIYEARHNYKEGWYQATEESNCHRFRAGSYSGHNGFRKLLVEAIHGVKIEYFWNNEEEYEGTPFYELLNFSDCEGVIGVKESKKLHEDFKMHKTLFNEYLTTRYEKAEVDDYMDLYKDWTISFAVASNKGAVLFQ